MDIKHIGLAERIFKPLSGHLKHRVSLEAKDEVFLSPGAMRSSRFKHNDYITTIMQKSPDVRQALIDRMKHKLHDESYWSSINLDKLVDSILHFSFKLYPSD